MHLDVDRLVGQVAGDVGEQAAEHEHGSGLGDLGGHGQASGHLVVEGRERHGALVVGLDQDAGQDGHRRARRKSAGDPGDRLGQDFTLDAELHGIPT